MTWDLWLLALGFWLLSVVSAWGLGFWWGVKL